MLCASLRCVTDAATTHVVVSAVVDPLQVFDLLVNLVEQLEGLQGQDNMRRWFRD
jgi:hypothetical protein